MTATATPDVATDTTADLDQNVPCIARFGFCCYRRGVPCPRPADVRLLVADDGCDETLTWTFCATCWASIEPKLTAGVLQATCGGWAFLVAVEPIR